MEEFDIEKIESLDYDSIRNQLKYMFKEEKDIVNFINFLKNVYKFVSLSADKRHVTLIDLCYFKSQIQLFEKKISSTLSQKKNDMSKSAFKKAKTCGEKITESVLNYYADKTDVINGLEELYNLVSSWSSYMNDLYFMCSQTNKNLGAFE